MYLICILNITVQLVSVIFENSFSICNGCISPATVALNKDDRNPISNPFITVVSFSTSLSLIDGPTLCTIARDEKLAKLARLNVANCLARADRLADSCCSSVKATNSLKTTLSEISRATSKLSDHGTPIMNATGVNV